MDVYIIKYIGLLSQKKNTLKQEKSTLNSNNEYGNHRCNGWSTSPSKKPIKTRLETLITDYG
jgi:hypothetical protein